VFVGMLTPPRYLILPLICPGVRVCPIFWICISYGIYETDHLFRILPLHGNCSIMDLLMINKDVYWLIVHLIFPYENGFCGTNLSVICGFPAQGVLRRGLLILFIYKEC
jgi:hypothetical protein